ncbi:TonB-dependent receptor [uncultured Duncaniella sp.]|uniref:SusC/RagA family TonB-linked outer membrane protein n=1 Tax=uncultured Duncaniella sp. TaxID=2768039 RepID=UPI002675F4FA|nr:TonB-dependent receptor [uncultured Duncaniella sp.]
MIKSNLKIYPWRGSLIGGVMAACFTALSPASIQAAPATVQATPAAAKVTGEVLDATGEPLIGASVMVKGTTDGVATDLDGRFTLNVPMGATLVVSYVGYKTQEVNVNSDNLVITLADDTAMLDEVVVVGYGTQKKATLTGAVATVGSEQLSNKGTLSSPVQALQGQVPGVIITRNSSAPGDESWGMKLRGAVSKNNSDPLIIIDGVEYESVNDLRLINPSDIESMNFLKDAAASIYGSKAAGGVVIITTKRAKDAKIKIDYNGSVTIKKPGLVSNMMSLDQWANALISARTNDGYDDNDTWMRYAKLALEHKNHYIDLDNSGHPFGGTAFTDVADFPFFDTNWFDIMWGNAASTTHELAIAGGKEGALFRLSLGYMYDDSNLKWGNNNNNRYNFRLTNQFDLSKTLKLQSIVSYNRQDQVAPTQIGSALNSQVTQPGFPSSTKDGKPYGWGTWGTPNWKAELGGDNKLKVSAVNISENLTWDIIDGLRAVATLGYNTSQATRDTQSLSIDFYNYTGNKLINTSPIAADTSYKKSSSRTDFYSVQGYLEWTKTFAERHDVKLMGGWQYNLKQYDYVEAETLEINPSLGVINGSGKTTNKGNAWEESIMSYYGRANYSYMDKYLLEGQVRYDGSSKFQPENRWAAFWGASAGWRLGQEKFMEWSRNWLDELKIRASYGNVGNQSGIDRYDGALLYNFNSTSKILLGNGLVSTLDTNGKLISTGRTWERVHNYNLGVDFGFLNSRLVGSVEVFRKKINNMLIDVDYPGILGDKAPTANLGKFKAWGWEGQATWRDRIGNVSYHIGGTFTYADNKLLDNGGDEAIRNGVTSNREGYPLNSVFGLRYCGKIQNEDQLEKYIDRYAGTSQIGNISKLRLGDNMYEDVNGDGKLDTNDFVYLGSDDPKIQFSMNAGLEWKGFDVQVVFQGAGKRTVWRDDANRIPMRATYLNSPDYFVGRIWSKENPDGFYPSLTNQSDINNYNYQCSSWQVQDGSYIRLKNVTVGYTFNEKMLKPLRVVNSIRLYFTGTDLWEHSKINDGWDPEASRKVSGVGRYPFLRNYTVGLNVGF